MPVKYLQEAERGEYMNLENEAIVALNSNSAAILILVGVLVLHIRTMRERNVQNRLFTILVITSIVLGVVYILDILSRQYIFQETATIKTFMYSIEDISIDVIAMIWYVYVLNMCFGRKDYLKRKLKSIITPIVIVLILDVINLFTGAVFYFDEQMIFRTTFLYVLEEFICYGYMLASFALMVIYRHKSARLHFFAIWSIFIPIMAGSVFEDATGYEAFSLGLAIGIAVWFISMTNTRIFEDPESGFFNLHYLDFLKDLMERGKYDLGCILVCRFADEDPISNESDMIREMLPEASNTLRISRTEIMTFATITDRSAVDMLADDMEMIAGELNTTATTESFIRQKGESGQDLLHRFLSGRKRS